MKSAAFVVLGAGIVAALHTGKVPAALPAVQAEFGISLVFAGTLISVLQMATACIGLFGGALVDRFGHARCMAGGLFLLGLGSAWGSVSGSAYVLLASRVVEGLGLVFTVLPGPSLLRQVIPPSALMRWLGWWSAYMPLGMGLGLLLVPLAPDWRMAWAIIAFISFAWAAAVFRWVGGGSRWNSGWNSSWEGSWDGGWSSSPANGSGSASRPASGTSLSLWRNARRTLANRGAWLLCLGFCFYAAQFMGVFGFLPKIYKEAGVSPAMAGLLTSVGVLANAWGNVQGGKLAQRGRAIDRTILSSAVIMIFTAWLIFAAPLQALANWFFHAPDAAAGFWLRYLAVLWFSAAAGRIPASFFNLGNRFAVDRDAVATTVGFMQQGGAIGQLFAPVVIAWVVTSTGNWSQTWWVTGSFALVLMGFTVGIGRELQMRKLRVE